MMKTDFKRLICILLGVFIFGALLQAEKQPVKDVRSILSRSEFKASGLNKLSEEELIQLSGNLFGWKDIKPLEPVIKKEDSVNKKISYEQEQNFGNERIVEKKKSKEPETKEIRSMIKGSFQGWSGKTRFTLDNGQVWKQIDNKKFRIKTNNPEIVITKGMFGSYFLSVKGWGSRCKVERIK